VVLVSVSTQRELQHSWPVPRQVRPHTPQDVAEVAVFVQCPEQQVSPPAQEISHFPQCWSSRRSSTHVEPQHARPDPQARSQRPQWEAVVAVEVHWPLQQA
jgi:hypothetical protein